jgi:Cyclic nucleotide-binding domain
MRIESSVTSISWIPSEAIEGLPKLPFQVGITHYDDPPPEVIEDLEGLVAEDRFREANELKAFIEVEDGKIVEHGHLGRAHLGVTRVVLGKREVAFQAVAFPTLRPDPEVHDDRVRFVQTVGGRTALPAPRRVRHKPYVQFASSVAWTTLALTIHREGHIDYEVVGASPFPRHWIYDDSGKLVQKTGTIDFKKWYRESFGGHTPWGDEESEALVTEVETALERELSHSLMRAGSKPKIRRIATGETLVEQGEKGEDLFLLLDGLLAVEIDGDPLAEIGPGAILGERALLEEGSRTSTLRAVTNCKVAVVGRDQISDEAAEELASSHRREDE